MQKSASSRSSARSSKSRRIESQSSNLFLEREPVVLFDRAVRDSRTVYFRGPPLDLPPLFPDRLPETRRARFVSQPLSLWRCCQTPVKTTTVPWPIGAATTRAPPLSGLKTIRSPTGFSPDHNCARLRGKQDSSPPAKPTVRSLIRFSQDDEK
jgi:hypothetical protein